jgi:hypothetical protein
LHANLIPREVLPVHRTFAPIAVSVHSGVAFVLLQQPANCKYRMNNKYHHIRIADAQITNEMGAHPQLTPCITCHVAFARRTSKSTPLECGH